MPRDLGEFEPLRPYGAREPERRAAAAARRLRAHTAVLVPELRPRSVGELLDLAFEVLRSRFAAFVAVGAVLWLPVRAVQPFIGLHVWQRAGEANPFGALFVLFFNLLSAAIVTCLAISFASLLTADHLRGRPQPLTAVFRTALLRIFPVAVLTFVTSFLTAFGCMCLCIPGLFLTFKLYSAPAVCVLERASIASSISRSFELSTGRFLPWFAVWLVTVLIGQPFGAIAGVADNPDARAALLESLPVSELVFDVVIVVFSSLFNGIATAVQGVVAAVWYFDCRTRREGIDLAARLEELRAEAAGPAGAAP